MVKVFILFLEIFYYVFKIKTICFPFFLHHLDTPFLILYRNRTLTFTSLTNLVNLVIENLFSKILILKNFFFQAKTLRKTSVKKILAISKMVLKKIINTKYILYMVFASSLNIFHVSLAKNASTDFRVSNSFLRLSSTLVKAQSTFLDQTLLKICQG